MFFKSKVAESISAVKTGRRRSEQNEDQNANPIPSLFLFPRFWFLIWLCIMGCVQILKETGAVGLTGKAKRLVGTSNWLFFSFFNFFLCLFILF